MPVAVGSVAFAVAAVGVMAFGTVSTSWRRRRASLAGQHGERACDRLQIVARHYRRHGRPGHEVGQPAVPKSKATISTSPPTPAPGAAHSAIDAAIVRAAPVVFAGTAAAEDQQPAAGFEVDQCGAPWRWDVDQAERHHPARCGERRCAGDVGEHAGEFTVAGSSSLTDGGGRALVIAVARRSPRAAP